MEEALWLLLNLKRNKIELNEYERRERRKEEDDGAGRGSESEDGAGKAQDNGDEREGGSRENNGSSESRFCSWNERFRRGFEGCRYSRTLYSEDTGNRRQATRGIGRKDITDFSYAAAENDVHRFSTAQQRFRNHLARTDEDECDKAIPF